MPIFSDDFYRQKNQHSVRSGIGGDHQFIRMALNINNEGSFEQINYDKVYLFKLHSLYVDILIWMKCKYLSYICSLSHNSNCYPEIVFCLYCSFNDKDKMKSFKQILNIFNTAI